MSASKEQPHVDAPEEDSPASSTNVPLSGAQKIPSGRGRVAHKTGTNFSRAVEIAETIPAPRPPSGLPGAPAPSSSEGRLPPPPQPRQIQASSPHLEIGDPITYDPALFDANASGPWKAVTTGPDTVSPKRLSAPPTDDEYIGTVISERYRIEELIGEGGMGRVYLATHAIIGKKVAIKILHTELARDKEAVGRFLREAQAASSIGNDHIVDISDFGEIPDGSTYFVMEYLDGLTLGELLEAEGALPANKALKIGAQLCDGLAAAHAKQIVHRDLKPENVSLVEQGNDPLFCKIVDFGIAKVSAAGANTKLTLAGAVFGTPHYMSPEQAAGVAVDCRTDVYSLGVMLYEMLAGALPFSAESFMGILTQHMYKAPPRIEGLPVDDREAQGLEAVALKCLSKKPEARYANMTELAADLERIQRGGVPLAIADMVERAEGFEVPANYFETGVRALVAKDATEEPAVGGRRNGMWAMGAAAALLVAGFFVFTGQGQGSEMAALPEEAQSEQSRERSASAITPGAAAAADLTKVLVHAIPAGASAEVDGQKVSLPNNIAVPNGGEVQVTISAKGHHPQELTLDGSKARVEVRLSRIARKQAQKRRTPVKRTYRRPAVRKKKPKKTGDTVNPWGPE